MKITDYVIVVGTIFEVFEKHVKEMIKQGWACQGGISVVHMGASFGSVKYYQAMVKPETLGDIAKEIGLKDWPKSMDFDD